MNLLNDTWMPVRNGEGHRHWIRPDQLGDPAWRAFDADRPDFNGALAQFAIGLLQTSSPVDDPIEWRRLLNTPPDAATLGQWFGPVAAAFVLDGEGPRFMQDLDLGSDSVAVNDIGALLIESPGEQTLKNNADHFVKRAQVQAMCPACAALALFTLQLNAPSGGAGHRTGLRGGGPLTTLVLAPGDAALWQHVWMNVRLRSDFLAQGGDPAFTDPQRSFPWLGPLNALQAPTPQGELAQSQVHPAHMYWAMPRRIRLQFDGRANGICDLCARPSSALVSHYGTKNYGLNYKGAWNHPLSPYYAVKEEWLPLHPQPDGLRYRHWLAWVLGAASERQTTRVARVVERAIGLDKRTLGGPLRLWAFGYDMDNMKARCWYESTLPLYGLPGCSLDARRGVQAEVGRWLDGAELAAEYLLAAVRSAWFTEDAKKNKERSEKLAFVKSNIWDATEPNFYRQLQALIDAVRDGADPPPLPAREAWHAVLASAALNLFDARFVGAGAIELQNPRRAALAHQQLRRNLYGPKLKLALGLPVEASEAKAPRKTARPSTPGTLKEAA